MIRRIMKLKTISLYLARAASIIIVLNAAAWSMARSSSDPSAPPPPAWTQWVPMVMLVGVFYFFLLRPQSKQRKERETMLGALKKGDKIVTQSGFIVTVLNVGPQILEVRLNDETRVQMMRSGVSEVLPESADASLATTANGSPK